MHNQTFFKKNKYNAVRSKYGGYNYSSRLEANQAAELDLLLRAKKIKAWDRQFKVEFDCCRLDGTPVNLGSHKVDFRVHELDGSFSLIETKGMVTADYMIRKRLLEKLWLPEHPEYSYTVVK